MNIELNKESEQLLQAMLASCQLNDPNEYIASLIREDSLTRKHMTNTLGTHADSWEKAAIAGLESGDPIKVDTDYWQSKRTRQTGRQNEL